MKTPGRKQARAGELLHADDVSVRQSDGLRPRSPPTKLVSPSCQVQARGGIGRAIEATAHRARASIRSSPR